MSTKLARKLPAASVAAEAATLASSTAHEKDNGLDHELKTTAPNALVRIAIAVVRYSPLLAFFAVWELISQTYPGLSIILPPPSEVVSAAYKLLQDGTLQRDIFASLQRVFTSLGFAECAFGPIS